MKTVADASLLKTKIESRTARLGVVGLGYVGLPLAMLYSRAGFQVTGFDVDVKKVETLSAGKSYIKRILAEEIQELLESKFRATADYSQIRNVDAVMICVPTPLDEHHGPDMTYIEDTAGALAPHLKAGQLIILESTTYPGTTEEILIPLLEGGNRDGLVHYRDGADESRTFHVAYSPEREDPGNTDVERADIPKVVGAAAELSRDLAGSLYNSIFRRIVPVSSLAAAEMTKLLENIYRCVNIALVNELKLLCLRMNLDIWEVIAAAKTKPFGFQAFYPGPGLGGHCIPIDPFYLTWKAKEFDFSTRFIDLAGEINTAMPYAVIEALANSLNDRGKAVKGSKVLVLGLAYKKDIDDLRESPSLTLIELLRKRGADVDYNDPFIPTVGRGRQYDLNMQSADLDNLGSYDCVLISTDHSDYDYPRIVRESQLVIDTRNATAGLDQTNVVRA
ncbi:MAG TPA: nucleotide sugar dehydrogenase [Acidobacteriaceae bacterium]|nr:nucleotide sugar dehydrogenase [Acidobacteriaceae bacterium]